MILCGQLTPPGMIIVEVVFVHHLFSVVVYKAGEEW